MRSKGILKLGIQTSGQIWFSTSPAEFQFSDNVTRDGAALILLLRCSKDGEEKTTPFFR